MKPAKLIVALAIFAGVCASAAGQVLFEPDASMTYPLDQGARPEGCGTSNFPFPHPNADLLTGLGTGRNLEQVARTIFQEPIAGARSDQDVALSRELAPSVVLVVTGGGLGSGSLISGDGDVLTNWHLVKGFADVAIVFKPARPGSMPGQDDILRGRVVKVDEVSDLALVRLAAKPEGRIPLRLGAADGIAIGANVHAIGQQGGQAWSYANGVIGKIHPAFEWSDAQASGAHHADAFQTNAILDPASPGTPLVSDTGALLGISGIDRVSPDGLSHAISSVEVGAFLRRQGDRRFAAAVPASGTPLHSGPKSACRPMDVYQGRTVDNTGLVAAYDTRCTGRVDLEIVVPDDKSKPIMLRADRNLDGKPDILLFDFSRQGHWDLSFWDSQFDGAWGLVGHHPDGAIEPSSYESADAYRARLARK